MSGESASYGLPALARSCGWNGTSDNYEGSGTLFVLTGASTRQQHAASEQVELPSAEHEALEQFDLGHVPLHLAAAPGVGEGGSDRGIVAAQARRERADL